MWQNTWVKGSVTNECAAIFTNRDSRLARDRDRNGHRRAAVSATGSWTAATRRMTQQLALIGAAKTVAPHRSAGHRAGHDSVPRRADQRSGRRASSIATRSARSARCRTCTSLLSNLNASAGGLPITEPTYSNGWTVADVGRRIKSAMQALPNAPRGAALDALVCSKLHIAPFRYNSREATWPDGTPLASHSKIVEVDTQALSVSSHNMYREPPGIRVQSSTTRA